jgi:hypothetical protein
MPESPPVAITSALSPSSAAIRRIIPSTASTAPNITPDCMLASVSFPMTEGGKPELDFRELRRAAVELGCRGFEPERDDPPQVIAGGGDHVERRGRPEIDHHERAPVFPEPGDRVAETVRPHHGGVGVEHAMPRSSEAVTVTGSDLEILAGQRFENVGEIGDDGRYSDAVDRAARGSPSAQKLFIVSQFSSTVRWVRLAMRQSAASFSPS